MQSEVGTGIQVKSQDIVKHENDVSARRPQDAEADNNKQTTQN